ncbi:hypothetical protein [Micromonospora sp. NBRC 101691]|uniref:hypothetical protein n=1 Tax=Micromonospora sp. NBRC 101691 TaxID=3032198 RepID=UPI0024A221D8|nr:hypothetical protein [Micromonospora sp. NBRC 101691]GLY20940.1 hypothetical protein Misp04_06720 [Micromonospora sp. NBRC 101691]
MNDDFTSATNVADGSATVGFQAHTVHEVSFYQVAPDDPPEKKYQTGVRCLAGGIPTRARLLFEHVIAAGHGTSKVRFHWFLALLSDRSLHDLATQDTTALRAARSQPVRDDDEYAEGLRIVHRLLDAVSTPNADHGPLLKDLDRLPPDQHDKILRHLHLVIDGPLQDQLWRLEISRVLTRRLAADRQQRVWKFFQPVPAGPRVAPVPPNATQPGAHLLAWVATSVFAAAALHLGWILVQHGAVGAAVAWLVAAGGGYVAAWQGREWGVRAYRSSASGHDHRPWHRTQQPPPGGFTHQVDNLFQHYFARYLPYGQDRHTWMQRTAGIRKELRDEVVEIYREQRVTAPQVAWLIRYLASDVRSRWERGTLFSRQDDQHARPGNGTAAALGLAALGVGGLWTAAAAMAVAPLAGLTTLVLLLGGGAVAARTWLHILVEERRHAADLLDRERRLADRQAAFQRWCAKLADKPDDTEMAAWLECDRKLLMDETLRHYQLKPSDVIAHAFVDAPAPANRKRARVRYGPWRYSRYRILLFLLTRDGVRQASAELDFERILFSRPERMNYRFEAVSHVRVVASDVGHPRHVTLRLVGGDMIEVPLSDEDAERPEPGEDVRLLSGVVLDASGVRRTVHVLEGIAAEGKEWIHRQFALAGAGAAAPPDPAS